MTILELTTYWILYILLYSSTTSHWTLKIFKQKFHVIENKNAKMTVSLYA